MSIAIPPRHFPRGLIFNEGGGSCGRWTPYAGKQKCWDCAEDAPIPNGKVRRARVDELYMCVEHTLDEDQPLQNVSCLDHMGVFDTPQHAYAL